MAQKTKGRPRSFDKAAALTRAMHVFWSKGYDGASMKDLTTAMEINSPSLYAAFGDKEHLYHQCIDAYIDSDACAPLVAFEAEPDITKAVRAFFVAAIDCATQRSGGAQGCFLSSCVAVNASTSEDVRARLARALEETDTKLAARFAREVRAGHLPDDFPIERRAKLMFDLRQGLVFRARARQDPEELAKSVDENVGAVLHS